MKQRAEEGAKHLTLSKYLEIVGNAEFIRWAWKDEGNCVKATTTGWTLPNGDFHIYDPMEWFPQDEKLVPEDIAYICGHCTVRLECLSAAIYVNEVKGIWGGYSISVIRRIRRKIITALRQRRRQ